MNILFQIELWIESKVVLKHHQIFKPQQNKQLMIVFTDVTFSCFPEPFGDWVRIYCFILYYLLGDIFTTTFTIHSKWIFGFCFKILKTFSGLHWQYLQRCSYSIVSRLFKSCSLRNYLLWYRWIIGYHHRKRKTIIELKCRLKYARFLNFNNQRLYRFGKTQIC